MVSSAGAIIAPVTEQISAGIPAHIPQRPHTGNQGKHFGCTTKASVNKNAIGVFAF